MEQPRFQTLASLLAGGATASAAAGAHGVLLNLELASKVAIDGDLNPLLAQRDAFEAAKAELVTLRGVLEEKKKELIVLLTESCTLLKRTLGSRYSVAWTGTGFNYSLKIPQSVPRLQNAGGTLKGFLADHPELERANLMTSVIVGAAVDALTNAQTAVTLQKALVGAQRTARVQKEKALRLRLAWAMEELGRKISPVDDLWPAFGFNKPGLKAAPAVPELLAAILFGPNAISVKWKAAARASHYRVWKKVIGVDTEYVHVGSPADLDFTIEGLPGNSLVEVVVSAVNLSGESQLSTKIVVQIQ